MSDKFDQPSNNILIKSDKVISENDQTLMEDSPDSGDSLNTSKIETLEDQNKDLEDSNEVPLLTDSNSKEDFENKR